MVSVKCHNCGLVDRTTQASCRRCGSPLDVAGQTPAGAPPAAPQSALLKIVLVVGLLGGGLVALKFLVTSGYVRIGLLMPMALAGLHLLRRHLLEE